jgi:succinate dehydrogenase iron-sulfur subunit
MSRLEAAANAIPIPQDIVEKAMDAAACIGWGACAAVCPNASGMLSVGAKISQPALLPHGRPEAARRAVAMDRKMDERCFGNCSNERECEAECPKEISIANIARMNREIYKAGIFSTTP